MKNVSKRLGCENAYGKLLYRLRDASRPVLWSIFLISLEVQSTSSKALNYFWMAFFVFPCCFLSPSAFSLSGGRGYISLSVDFQFSTLVACKLYFGINGYCKCI